MLFRSPRAAEFVAWLRSQDVRLPDEVDGDAAGTRPDLIYRLLDGNVAIFVSGTGQDGNEQAGRDAQAHNILRDLGWSVITIGPEAEWPATVARYPSVFGTQ